MKTTSTESASRGWCAQGAFIALPIGLATALSVSNGPAVGIAIGAALGLVIWMNRRR
jgi:hypothetical protein